MKYYELNDLGRAGVDAAIQEHCAPAVIAHGAMWPWYEAAEFDVIESGGRFEIGPHYSWTGRPVVIDCPPEWYDVTELED